MRLSIIEFKLKGKMDILGGLLGSGLLRAEYSMPLLIRKGNNAYSSDSSKGAERLNKKGGVK